MNSRDAIALRNAPPPRTAESHDGRWHSYHRDPLWPAFARWRAAARGIPAGQAQLSDDDALQEFEAWRAGYRLAERTLARIGGA